MKICVANLGINNIKSACDFFSKFGEVYMINDIIEFQENTNLFILPGNGSFDTGMKMLKKKKFDKLLERLINTKILIIGICLGMQLLFNESEEAIDEKGLGFFDGKVEKINSKHCNIPLLGWYETFSKKNVLLNKKNFYFNNKYSCVPESDRYNLSYLDLIESKIIASIKKDNVIGFQFHPEKSSKNGHEIIENFLKHEKF